MTPEQQTLLQNLTDYLQEQTGQAITITDAKPLAGGASRDTWRFTVQQADEKHQYVMRRDLPTQMFEEALTREQEFRMMDAAYKSGVKVAPVRYLCTDESILGSPFFIMDYVPGISIGRKVVTLPELAQARQKLPGQMAQELAAIHALDYAAHNLDFLRMPTEGKSAAETVLDETYTILDELGVQNPVWEWALRWAQTHMPPPNQLTFVHGDFRIGNLLVDEDGL
ncbi:MAG: phosphotransferase family protein, partial [Anaerolineae bacterium]|nr:phosphotransferase family protein [Anaerolineae bacterium]